MNEELEFMVDEAESIEKNLALLERLLNQANLNEYEIIAFGTLLQNVYMGIENIIRCQLGLKGIRFHKGESWHKDLLRSAHENGLIQGNEYPLFLELEESRLRELAAPVPAAVRDFLSRIGSE